jgi:hypothetical protein
MASADGKELPVQERRSIFLALVEAQDAGGAGSRKVILERFAITGRQLRKIEREGLDAEGPPLALVPPPGRPRNLPSTDPTGDERGRRSSTVVSWGTR